MRQDEAWPNRACSGHGFAVGEPWGWSGEVASPAVVVGRLRRAADAIVSRPRMESGGMDKRLGKYLVYVAAPLFSCAEREFNLKIKAFLETVGFQVFLPQLDAGLLSDVAKKGESLNEAKKSIFQRDLSAIQEADIILFVLDGRVPDEGACIEAGVGFALGKECIGFQTDTRSQQFGGNNLMVEGVIRNRLYRNFDDLRGALIDWLNTALTALAVLVGSVGITYFSYTRKIGDSERLSGILAILTFMAFSEVLERVVSLTSIEDNIAEIQSSIKHRSEILTTSSFTPFREFVEHSNDVFIIGTTKVGFFSRETNFLIDLLRNGCHLRVILLDPNENNLYEVISRNMTVSSHRLLSDINNTIEAIRDLRMNLSSQENSRLQVRLSKGALNIGLLMVDSGHKSGRLQVNFYPYKTSPPNRIGMEIVKEDNPTWFRYFAEKYELLWSEIEDQSSDPTLIAN